MLKIAIVMLDSNIAEEVLDVFTRKDRTIYDDYYYDVDFEAEIIPIQYSDLPNFNPEVEAIISRGFMAYELRKLNIETPIVEIPVSSEDILSSIKDLIQKEKNQKQVVKIAVIGSTNMRLGVDSLDLISNVAIKSYNIESSIEIEKMVKRALADGYHHIIGGILTCSIAEKMGMSASSIGSSKDSIDHAVAETKRSAYVYSLAMGRALRFETIIKFINDGIIAVETSGQITVLNKAAQKILDLQEDNYSKRNIDSLTSDMKFNKYLSGTTHENDHIMKYNNDKYLMCNRIPVFLHDKKIGTVITLYDIARIQDVDRKFRKNIYKKGHIAKYTFYNIIGESDTIINTIHLAKKYSLVDSNILLIGKSGTGKEMLAQSIHNYSKRNRGPFVAVNCAAIAPTLLESELFGYTEGAFTGASKAGKIGLFELAHEGTIFLDEISELPYDLQGRLLRVIQEKEVMRIGSDTVTDINVRIISASNSNLIELVANNQFREDLYFRINTLRIDSPTLAERKEDIPLIVKSMMDKLADTMGVEELIVTDEAMDLLMDYDWPGNIRELSNICERLAVHAESGIITEDHFNQAGFIGEEKSNVEKLHKLMANKEDDEKDRIVTVLLQCKGNKQKAADLLGMSRSTLWRKINKYGL